MIHSTLLLLSSRLASSFITETLHATLLLLFVALLLRMLPALNAAARSVIWTAVLVVSVLMPFLPIRSISAGPATHVAGSVPSLHFAPIWSLAIASLWLLASLIRGSMLVAGALRLRQIWASAVPIPSSPASVQTRNGRSRSAALCLSAEVARPSIIGFVSPRILIPAMLYPRLSAPELSHIVLHEMEHLRRHDDWRNLVQKLALVLFPLNPALFWIDRRLAMERELACDESVLEATHSPRSYASCLVHLAEESALGRHLSLALGAWERRSELGRRIQRILTYRFDGQAKRGFLPAGAAISTAVLFGAVLACTPQLVTFTVPQPLPASESANLARIPFAALRTVTLHRQNDVQPRIVDAVVHIPSPVPPPHVKHASRKAAARTPHLRRVNAAQPLNRFVLTSWVISYAPEGTRDAFQPHFAVAVFDPQARWSAMPQVLSTDVLPTTGSIIVIQL